MFFPLLSVPNLRREMVKAFAGFSLPAFVLAANYPAVATGNWSLPIRDLERPSSLFVPLALWLVTGRWSLVAVCAGAVVCSAVTRRARR